VVFRSIYDTLVSKNPALEFEPLIAESFTISDDGLNYDFKIRAGMLFHDGTEVTAEHVKYTFDRAVDPDAPSQAASFINAYDHAEQLDAETVRLILKEPNAPFLPNIAVEYFGILPQHAVEALGDDFGKQPVGSGPWMFEEWIEGEQITLKPFADYVQYRTYVENKGGPRADELIFRVIPETQTQIAAFETGEINHIQVVPANEYQNLKDNEDYEVIVAEGGTSITSIEFQTIKPAEGQEGEPIYKPPFDDLNLRKAVAHAVNAQEIIDAVLFGLAQISYGPMPTGLFAWDPAIEEFAYAYDPDMASQLLEESGWTMGGDGVREKNGEKLEVVYWVWSGGNEEKISQVWQNQLGEVGIKINIETLDIGTMVARLPEAANNLNYMQVGWPEADILYVLTSFDWGVGRYKPADYIDLITKARQTSDQAERKELYFEAQKLFLEDLPWAPMWTELQVTAVRSEVKGFHTGADLTFIWEDAWVE
jgi:peptide/nickel transport system substrate-binding protein